VHERERDACSQRPWRVRGAVRAWAVGWPTGSVVGCYGLGNMSGVSGRPLVRLQALACCRSPGLQQARSSRHWRERERANGEVGGVRGLQVGSWCIFWAVA
jgi:hypothetical protein